MDVAPGKGCRDADKEAENGCRKCLFIFKSAPQSFGNDFAFFTRKFAFWSDHRN